MCRLILGSMAGGATTHMAASSPGDTWTGRCALGLMRTGWWRGGKGGDLVVRGGKGGGRQNGRDTP
ncbi:hypothetical protein [Actinoplanes sp. L3-i22]|uniref:hypothetical protein n=1 Tax=Actinoplanes sp. L3-i22 TaxID=2836373 RepID=UPI001C73F3CC|nr:hypothetical protein [Actinoplanes sp. L3-i22]BCY11540.1 hypothetical protein L3i22_066280 [Actinoplanes sp. L3-i22]